MSLEELNALPEPAARERLAGCLDVERWVDAVVVGRPYADLGALSPGRLDRRRDPRRRGAGRGPGAPPAHRRALDRLDLRGGLDRLDLRGLDLRGGLDGSISGGAADRAHSAREQSGVDQDDPDVTRRLAAGNRAYEDRFDRVFLIRAAGRGAEEILAELKRRLANDDAAEREETVTQLREIALLRLEGLVS